MKKLLPLLFAAVACAQSAFAQNDVTILVDLNSPPEGYRELTGQSAFMQFYIDGFSTGGQLDGVTTGVTGIGFTETFSPPPLENYVAFSYFGRINTYDDLGAPIDTSFIMALQPGVGVGSKVEDYFSYTESDLVGAFDDYDSPEFLTILLGPGGISDVSASKGEFSIPPLSINGTTLDLIAFIGGPDGDVGVKVGEISVSVVPEPSAVMLVGAVGMLALLRRRV